MGRQGEDLHRRRPLVRHLRYEAPACSTVRRARAQDSDLEFDKRCLNDENEFVVNSPGQLAREMPVIRSSMASESAFKSPKYTQMHLSYLQGVLLEKRQENLQIRIGAIFHDSPSKY